MKITIHDIETNQVIEREMTDAELAIYEADQAESLAKAEAEAKAASEKAALLEKLGITEDEARLLLG